MSCRLTEQSLPQQPGAQGQAAKLLHCSWGSTWRTARISSYGTVCSPIRSSAWVTSNLRICSSRIPSPGVLAVHATAQTDLC